MRGLVWLGVMLVAGRCGWGQTGTLARVQADGFAGGDVGARVMAAQASLGGRAGRIVVGQAGVLATAVTLGMANELEFDAAVTLTAKVTLAGANRVTCGGAGALKVVKGSAFTSAGNGVEIDHCAASGEGTLEASLLETKGASHVKVLSNVLTLIGTVHAVDGGDLEVAENTVTFGPGKSGYGAVWSGTNDVVVNHNSFVDVSTGVEFFNADADFNKKGPTTRAEVLAHGGRYRITNNSCVNSSACYWGSVGHDVVMTGNYAAHCSDVCYDLEGSVDGRVEGNRGEESGNGLGAVFFFSDHNVFLRNTFSSSTGSPLISVHNSSLRPIWDEFLTVQGNTLSCTKVICPAVTGDPAGDVTIAGNHLTDATISLPMYGGSMKITGNDLNFTLAGAKVFSAIAGPFLLNGATLEVRGNVTSGGVAQPAGSACISDSTGDFNSTVTVVVAGNRCVGGFPVDLATTNGGTNAGTGVVTTVERNFWGQGRVVHTHATGNVDRYVERGNFVSRGGSWVARD